MIVGVFEDCGWSGRRSESSHVFHALKGKPSYACLMNERQLKVSEDCCLNGSFVVVSSRYSPRFRAFSRMSSLEDSAFQSFDCPQVCLINVDPRATVGVVLLIG